jgi:prepilin-type N-terminal cleavage/methylation domain-containing protein
MRENDSSVEMGLGDSRGFTLVELILTIAILAIVTMPIMNYFTDSAKHSSDSRARQNATVEAQDILEQFKNSSYSLDDAKVVCSADPTWTVDVAQTAVGGKYTLTKEETVDRSTFSVTAEIDPLPSSAPITYKEYVIGTMDTTKDVIASEHGQALLNAEAAFYGKYKAAATGTLLPQADSLEDFKNLLDCNVVISSEPDSAMSDNKIIRVTYIYSYGGATALEGINKDVATDYTYSEEVTASSIPAADLENIYLFYTPLNGNDKITFQLKTDKGEVASDFGASSTVSGLNFFIVAQSSLDQTTGDVVSNVPTGYQLKVERADDASAAFGDAIAKVYTNLEDSEISSSSATTILSAAKLENSLSHYEQVNRLANITVTVNKDSKEYVKVTGTKIQN